jgi:hypothetical protein
VSGEARGGGKAAAQRAQAYRLIDIARLDTVVGLMTDRLSAAAHGTGWADWNRTPSARSSTKPSRTLLAWLQLLALDGRLARAEPATLRTDLFDIPAKLTHHARRRELKFDPAWPASHNAVTAWDRVQALPDPG